MDKDQIYKGLEEVVSSTLKDHDKTFELTENSNLVSEFRLDSMEVVTIIVKAELKFGVDISEEDLSVELVNPISNLVDYIEKQLVMVNIHL
ncbi:phosphopantetheine-binding protein [Lacrimispora brassicae]